MHRFLDSTGRPRRGCLFVILLCAAALVLLSLLALKRSGQPGRAAATLSSLRSSASSCAPNSAGTAGGACSTPLNPNSMYDDDAATCPANAGPAGNLAALESAAYRMITASTQRAFQHERQWCFGGWKGHATGKPYRRGRRYAFDAWVKFVVSFLDSYELLQMTPCPGRTLPLRALLMSALEDASATAAAAAAAAAAASSASSASASASSASSASSSAPLSPDPPPLAWWEGPWITAVTNAFSCGFDKAEDLHRVLLHGVPTATAAGNTNSNTNNNNNNNNNREYGYRNGLPSDIARGGGRGGSFAEDRVLQQAWRLTKGYMAGAQKQREKPLRQHDFDISLYVPFLVGNHLDPMYARYMDGGALRTGFPTYSGPAAWKVLHTLAARVAEVQEQCGDVGGAAVGGGAGGSGSGSGSGSSGSGGGGSSGGGECIECCGLHFSKDRRGIV